MNTNGIEAKNIISQFDSQLVGSIKETPVNKFRFNEFKSCFSDGVVDGSSFQAQRTVDNKIFALVHLSPTQASGYYGGLVAMPPQKLLHRDDASVGESNP